MRKNAVHARMFRLYTPLQHADCGVNHDLRTTPSLSLAAQEAARQEQSTSTHSFWYTFCTQKVTL